MRIPTTVVVWCWFLSGMATVRAAEPAVTPQQAEFFEKQVRPVLVENCFGCHGPEKQKAGLRLDSRQSVLKGADDGPVVKSGDPDNSRLVQAIRYGADIKMPPKGKLKPQATEALTTWIRMGVPWPDADGSQPVGSAKRHWAFQPIASPALPATREHRWPRTAIDRFILAKLETKGLTPSPAADRRTLIRRVTFDLIGLPPTPEEIAAFEADRCGDAFAKAMDRLLASPHYGERWGRYWLDVARYADTKGYVFFEESNYPWAYTYRDYVIRAFNDDLPFDQFIIQQIAADLLPLGEDRRPLAALGFLTLGRRFLNDPVLITDDRIDVTCRGLMGLTVSCARCHDHKFDPIPTKDYYALYGVFASSVEPKDLPAIQDPEPTDAYRAFEKELKALQAEVTSYQEVHRAELRSGNRKFRDELRKKQNNVDQL